MYRKEFGGNNPAGRDRFEDIVDRYGLKVRSRKRKTKTTDSTHGLPVYPNIIKDYLPVAPNRLWVSDITYISIWIDAYTYVFCYLSMILDAYTEEIVGWSVGPTLDTTHPVASLMKALKRIDGSTFRQAQCNATLTNQRQDTINLIHHPDRGLSVCRQ
jgi:transposase InsO family protein